MIEPMGNPIWQTRGQALLAFVTTPRTWCELKQWSAQQGLDGILLRHVVAVVDAQIRTSKHLGCERTWRKYDQPDVPGPLESAAAMVAE